MDLQLPTPQFKKVNMVELAADLHKIIKWDLRAPNAVPDWLLYEGDPLGHPMLNTLCELWLVDIRPGLPGKNLLFSKCTGPPMHELAFILRMVCCVVSSYVLLLTPHPHRRDAIFLG
jgi:hypothetical protein